MNEVNVVPTLSVLLPTLNDGFRLGVQLAAILPQLNETDELILLLDGSDELTCEVAKSFTHPALIVFGTPAPSGVCSAYNQLADLVSKDWILGASGNDEVQPGAIAAWRAACEQFPEARLMHGQIMPGNQRCWSHETSFIQPAQLPAIWRSRDWFTHGAASFIRRDVWGRGYVPSHGYQADAFQTLVIGWRHGLVDLHAYISRVLMDDGQFSSAHSDDATYNASVRAMRATFAEPEYDDVRQLGEEFWAVTGQLNERPVRDSYMSIERAHRLVKLMAEKRMSDGNDCPVNRLTGLFDMILWLRARGAKIENLVEVGAYEGASGELFALHYPNVISIDKWEGNEVRARHTFEDRRVGYPNWQPLPIPSMEAVQVMPDGQLDLVYIDASHTYEDVLADLKVWLPKVRPGGYIAGHDYGHDEPGVKRAVDEVLGKPDATFSDFSWIKAVPE